ncbi:hypothetical protein GMSM_15170 [Geomonas sp. Red276]
MEQAGANEMEAVEQAAGKPLASLRQELLDEIASLRRFSNRGLLALSLFLVVSTLAWRDFWFLPRPEKIVASLGAPPSPQTISIVLVLYTFSAIILSLSRLMAGLKHASSFCHVGYTGVFYLFYYFAQGLQDNYWAVFGAGFTILCLESYRIWTWSQQQLAKKGEQLAYLDRTGLLPVEDDEDEDDDSY